MLGQMQVGRAGLINRRRANPYSPAVSGYPQNIFGTGDIQPQIPGRTAFQGPLSPEDEAFLRQMALVQQGGGIMAMPQVNADAREQDHPIPASPILVPGASFTVNFVAGFTFSLVGMFVASEQAIDIIVDDVQVARKSQILAAGGISASRFSEVSTRGFQGDTVQQGQACSVTWRNIDTVDRIIQGATFIGLVAR